MIEQFTPEQIEIIKKELGITDRTKANKKTILAEQYARILKLADVPNYPKAKFDAWYAICSLCDHALDNYAKSGKPIEIVSRYSTIWADKRESYKQMANELIDVFEKYKNMEKTDG